MKLVINTCYGGFGLSDKAYEKLISWGVPVRKYLEEERDPATLRYIHQPQNEGEVIFDRKLDEPSKLNDALRGLDGRYWETWTRNSRSHPLIVRVVEELGSAANGRFASLSIVEIPDDIEYTIEEYDGYEHVAEKHRTWY